VSSTEIQLCEEIIHYAQRMNAEKLTPGKSGNISVRFGDACLITPSAIGYESLTVDDIVLIDFSGKVIRGQQQPSSEWHFHCALYKNRNDLRSVVHTHSTYSTALACAHEKIPAFHYMVAIAGGDDIPLAPYHLFGTAELSAAVTKEMEHRNACLLANHGLVTAEKDLQSAYALAVEIEQIAKQYCEALKIGTPVILNDTEMKLVIDKFKSYGKRT